MNKIFLICPADPSQMPYIQGYIRIIKELSFDYELIVWDRTKSLSDGNCYRLYRDSAISFKRGFFEYYKFSRFYNSVLHSNERSFVIAFGIPVLFFLRKSIFKKCKVIADIRDCHLLLKFFPSLPFVLKNTRLNVLSSAGFKAWLPQGGNYIVNHNTGFNSTGLRNVVPKATDKNQTISCIGALKDFDVLSELIVEARIRNEKRFSFHFHGEGVINAQLAKLRDVSKSVSIVITGVYEKHEEASLYESADWINVFMTKDNINNNTCLSNRLYNATYFGKPLLCYKGSCTSSVIERYNLGMVFDDVKDFYDNFNSRLNDFDFEAYNEGRRNFFEIVDVDNIKFEKSFRTLLVSGK